VLAVLIALGPGSAVAQGPESGYYVTFAARWCPNYTDVYANRERNNIVESLEDLGGNSPYGPTWNLLPGVNQILPEVEDHGTQTLAPEGVCEPLPDWTFTLGEGKLARSVTGAWGAMSVVTTPGREIVTEPSTPLRDQNNHPVPGDHQLLGAVNVQLTQAEYDQTLQSINCSIPNLPDACQGGLWVQGGTPTDPVLANEFGTPAAPLYGYAALRCAVDNLFGDNAEWVQFPAGAHHVFCYAYYVRPSPSAGTITIRKQVVPPPTGTGPSFPFDGSINFALTPFRLAHNQEMSFERASGQDWTVAEGDVAGYNLASINCSSPGTSAVSVALPMATIHLASRDHVTCTFTNEPGPPPGGLTIRKITLGGVGTFHYRVTPAGGGAAHELTATTHQEDVAVDATPSLAGLPAGTYEIHESAPPTHGGVWRRVSVICDDQTKPTTGPVTVVVTGTAPGSDCTFTNKFFPRGSISIGKITHGDTGTAKFVVTGSGLDHRQSATTTKEGVEAPAKPETPGLDSTDHLRLGEYRILEQSPAGNPPDGWSLTGVECNGVQVPFGQGTIVVSLTTDEPHQHCVFTDTFTREPPPPPPPDPGPDEEAAQQVADLGVIKHASTPVARTGDTVAFRITVTNHGPNHAARAVLNDQLFGSARLVAIHTDRGSCSAHLPVFCELGTLAPGEKAHITVRLRITSQASPFADRAVVGSATPDPNKANNVASARVRLAHHRPSAPRFTG
jgi:uncharacterized repeat protein (TIGR01451 family)